MNRYLRPLAELVVELGANVQPGQIVAISSEPGKEPLARTLAGVAYERGAKFVDVSVFDLYVKRARALHAEPKSLSFVPPWYGERLLRLAQERGASIALSGPAAPDALDGLDPTVVGKDLLPRVREWMEVLNAQTVNWTVAPCPTSGWAGLVFPELDPDEALDRLWDQIAHVCRLDEPDPVGAWRARLAQLTSVADRLTALELDSVHLEGPGTDLRIGLFESGRWISASLRTVDGLLHHPNLPTEEVFTTPDPERVDGVVSSTKPLFTGGMLVEGFRVTFAGGRATSIEAQRGAETLRTLAARDVGACRLGEVALVDREGRIGGLGTIFYDTLLDENAASHIAFGAGLQFGVENERDRERINRSEIHIDFMIGSDEVAVTGVCRDGSEVPLLRGGVWQV